MAPPPPDSWFRRLSFPLGLLATAVPFDLINLLGGSPVWLEASYRMIAAGILTGLAAALFGWIDWFALPTGTRATGVQLQWCIRTWICCRRSPPPG